MKVLVTTSSFGKFDQSPIKELEEAGFEIILNPKGRKLKKNEVLELLLNHKPIAILAGVEPLTSDVIVECSDFLKIISRCGIGLDSVDIEAAKKYGIKIFNTPDAPTQPVAELTLGLMLNLFRQISFCDYSIKKGQWQRPTVFP